jgi:hypothetical protein
MAAVWKAKPRASLQKIDKTRVNGRVKNITSVPAKKMIEVCS